MFVSKNLLNQSSTSSTVVYTKKLYLDDVDIETLIANGGTGGGTGGGTNPTDTYIPYNNAGTFDDSYLVNDTASSILNTESCTILAYLFKFYFYIKCKNVS